MHLWFVPSPYSAGKNHDLIGNNNASVLVTIQVSEYPLYFASLPGPWRIAFIFVSQPQMWAKSIAGLLRSYKRSIRLTSKADIVSWSSDISPVGLCLQIRNRWNINVLSNITCVAFLCMEYLPALNSPLKRGQNNIPMLEHVPLMELWGDSIRYKVISPSNIGIWSIKIGADPKQHWLVVSIPLKTISQLGWLFPISGHIKHVPNHQPE